MASGPGLPGEALAKAFNNQTIVQTVRLSAGGTGLRIRLTNEYGSQPLKIGAARVALVDDKGVEVTGSSRTVTFSGIGGTIIPAGSPWLSDTVDLKIPDRARLRITLYFPEDTGLCTCHAAGGETGQVSPRGNFIDAPFDAESTITARAFISEVDIKQATPRPVVVTYGDSITDGYSSTLNQDRRWPDRLSERLAANGSKRGFGVANAAISGNRILADGAIPLFGQSAIARFDRDVLSVPGVSTVILLIGVNDIGRGGDAPISADALIAGYRQMITRAKAHGIWVVGGTILPYEGASYYRADGNAVRQTINRWILSSGEFDGTIDFDRATRDPARPNRLRANLQSGDWLHPNDEGYRVMGNAIPLSVLR
ncbi:SGNH/GDSL hydrolase family protein [Sphingomonas aliaeris]|uniref:SGNH/GDSL hydrolase family protein n=1 Tax=Sphingomonas aliaeris TaxID=2759526 RepID=A0A974NVD1_9SPHN|nr:SGNH/GDSL hydrolase family protein [Sphingomonas aliaeris]QQV77611.1 SGNH/GDSL hydrolase family protein [Sphingomonas aliaeris]